MRENKADRNKKRAAAASLAVVVLAVFLWLGLGLISEARAAGREDMWPMLALYAAFPAAAAAVSVRRIKELRRISEEDELAAPESGDETAVPAAPESDDSAAEREPVK